MDADTKLLILVALATALVDIIKAVVVRVVRRLQEDRKDGEIV
jgi:hypothetical protein